MKEERTAWRLKLQNKMKLVCFPRDCGMEPAGHGAPGGSQEGASVLRALYSDLSDGRVEGRCGEGRGISMRSQEDCGRQWL